MLTSCYIFSNASWRMKWSYFRLKKQAHVLLPILHFQLQKNAKSFIIVFPVYTLIACKSWHFRERNFFLSLLHPIKWYIIVYIDICGKPKPQPNIEWQKEMLKCQERSNFLNCCQLCFLWFNTSQRVRSCTTVNTRTN